MSNMKTNHIYQGDCIVLDPFLGSGTTAVAARHLKRSYVGIELSKEYCKMIHSRLAQKQLF